MRYLIPILLLALFLVSCRAEHGVEGEVVTPFDPVAGPATWADVQAAFSGTCTGCHGANPPSLNYATLTTGSGTCPTNAGKYVEPGDKTLSCLWLSITGAEGDTMFGAAPFAPAKTDVVGSWIDDGANP